MSALGWKIKASYFLWDMRKPKKIDAEMSGPFGFRQSVGPSLAIGGFGLMSIYYQVAVVFFCIGLVISLLEFIFDRWYRERRLIGYLLAVAFLAWGIWFAGRYVWPKAPLHFDAYLINDSDSSEISGIPWNSHLSDLRVWVNNTSKNHYENVSIDIKPAAWTYKAEIVGEKHGCYIDRLRGTGFVNLATNIKGGATKITIHEEGNSVTADDNAGDKLETFISDGGYRLRCDALRDDESIQIVFALAALDPEKYAQIVGSNTGGGVVAELKPLNRFELLGPRPSPKEISLDSSYKLEFRPISASQTIGVHQ